MFVVVRGRESIFRLPRLPCSGVLLGAIRVRPLPVLGGPATFPETSRITEFHLPGAGDAGASPHDQHSYCS